MDGESDDGHGDDDNSDADADYEVPAGLTLLGLFEPSFEHDCGKGGSGVLCAVHVLVPNVLKNKNRG